MNQRGVAFPMAMIVLAALASLSLAFAVMATSEPQIAYNQLASAQARAVAESGIERALWALTKGDGSPSATGALTSPLPASVPAPYNGTQVLAAGSLGVFTVKLSNGAQANEIVVEAVGYVPNNVKPTAIKKIQTTITRVKLLSPPCALCAGGESPAGVSAEIQLSSSVTINASNTSGTARARYCTGVTPTSAVYSQGPTVRSGTSGITAPPGGSKIQQNRAQSTFAGFTLTNADVIALKSLARANGTYYAGSQTWTTAPPNGLVFVDTPSGNPLTTTSPSSDRISVTANWSGTWSGWLVVAGSVTISGSTRINGLVYAQNDVTLSGGSAGQIVGAVISSNRLDTSTTNVDTNDTASAPLVYDCPNVRNGGGTVPQGWFVKPGTYREVAGT